MDKRQGKKKILTYVLVLFIAFIMVSSIIGFIQTGTGDNANFYEYKGNRYIAQGNGWLTYIENKPIVLSYGPVDLEQINPGFDLNQIVFADKVYLSFNPAENIQRAIIDLTKNINFNKPLINSCFSDSELCANLPLKTCEDASIDTVVILLKESNKTEISFENNCLAIEGESDFIIRVIDKLVLTSLGLV